MHVELRESAELLANPGMGWQTFHHFADEDPALDGLPSSVAYFRWYWDELEPADGEIRFDLIDDTLARAKRAGQQLAFRVMCLSTGSRVYGSPKWLRDAGCPGFEFTHGHKQHWPEGAEEPVFPYSLETGEPQWHFSPDFESPLFTERHERLIHALGERYDGHPDVDLIDVGSVGLWGEWHMSGTGYEIPPEPTCRRISRLYREAFPTQPMVHLIGNDVGLRMCGDQQVGWRADCLGDLGGFSDCWNHMDNAYKQSLAAAGAFEVWQRAPVAWESCWDARKWHAEGWDVDSILDYGLMLHGSYLNNKSAPVPPEVKPKIERFLRRLGYRLVLRRAEAPERWPAGGRVDVQMQWENVGVAPPYRDWPLAFRLRPAGGGAPAVIVTDTTARGWMPGPFQVSETLALPSDLSAGAHALEVGLLDERGGGPCVRLAVTAAEETMWYPLGQITVV